MATGQELGYVLFPDLQIQRGHPADWSPAYKDFVIRGKDMVRFKDFVATNPAVMNLEGYDTLIDITRENDVFKLTFSNGDYAFKILVSWSTRGSRGRLHRG